MDTSRHRAASSSTNPHTISDLGALRRLHSDGEAPLQGRRGSTRYGSSTGVEDNGETWMEFLRNGRRQSAASGQGPVPPLGLRSRSHISSSSAGHREQSMSRRSQATVIDLTSPARPSVIRTDSEVTRERRSGEILLPRWQPDEEVSKCPICGTTFSFWYRKHHCRKCGRVVCANCSPHRITIPRQYIVHPPGVDTRWSGAFLPIIDLTGEEGSEAAGAEDESLGYSNPALGGGAEVRICNPCVPDPNFGPPPQSTGTEPTQGLRREASRSQPLPSSHHSSQLGSRENLQHVQSSSTLDGVAGRQRLEESTAMRDPTRRATLGGGQQAPPYPLRPSFDGSSSPRGHRSSRHHLTDGVVASSSSSAPTQSWLPHLTSRSRHWHSPSADASIHTTSDPSRHPAFHYRSLLPPEPPVTTPQPPRRVIPEEDECPICHEELPPKGPDGSEVDRERHVAECIESHFSSGHSTSGAPPSVATDAAVAASAITPSQSGGVQQGSPPAVRHRHVGSRMLVYRATEKDCVGEDGEPQECVICFEDFEVGAEMGRLECLCKFHRACIRQWWDTKGVGVCPVHRESLP